MSAPQQLNRFTSGALVDEMRERNSTMTKSEAELAVARVFDSLKSLVDKDAKGVRIQNFGTFKNKFKAGRVGRNPATGETIQIAEKTVLAFSPAKGL